MSKVEELVEISLPVDKAMLICKKVIATSRDNIRILDVSEARIVFKSKWWLSDNIKVDLRLSTKSETSSLIQLYGSVFGLGPIKKSYLKSRLRKYLFLIEIEAENIQNTSMLATSSTVTEELARLATLKKDGFLTEEGKFRGHNT